jgi:TetR/AcrR family transcriptional repressor of nem operon
MSTKLATKQDTRTALLEVGMDMMLEKGYTNTGIQEVLSALQVPKGSFYHYFDSKENFVVEIIRHFEKEYSTQLRATLQNSARTPLERLRDYCAESKQKLECQNCRKGCLIGNLSQEMADQSEVLRHELVGVMRSRCNMFSACIEEGQKFGDITKSHSAIDLAQFFLSAWSGAVMAAKTIKSIEPLQNFETIILNDMLKA